MTQDEIIDMARQAGLDWHTGWVLNVELPNRFETFANLVAAKEREACAQIADKHTKASFMGAVGAAIRARGEQK
jgi:hypothetical protein